MARAPLSIVVPSRDRPAMLQRGLDALARAVSPEDEVIVVDSASHDAAEVEEIAIHANARIVRSDTPGVNRARNLGWRAAYNQLLVFVDDDVVVDPPWADAFAHAAAAHSSAAFITGRTTALAAGAHTDVATKDDDTPSVLDRQVARRSRSRQQPARARQRFGRGRRVGRGDGRRRPLQIVSPRTTSTIASSPPGSPVATSPRPWPGTISGGGSGGSDQARLALRLRQRRPHRQAGPGRPPARPSRSGRSGVGLGRSPAHRRRALPAQDRGGPRRRSPWRAPPWVSRDGLTTRVADGHYVERRPTTSS